VLLILSDHKTKQFKKNNKKYEKWEIKYQLIENLVKIWLQLLKLFMNNNKIFWKRWNKFMELNLLKYINLFIYHLLIHKQIQWLIFVDQELVRIDLYLIIKVIHYIKLQFLKLLLQVMVKYIIIQLYLKYNNKINNNYYYSNNNSNLQY
jgi:hypothetical protein